MPTYEYECGSCESVVEVFHSIKDKGLSKCPKCGSKRVQQIISGGAALVFKGSGFYVTDSKNNTSSKSITKEPSKDLKNSEASASDTSQERSASIDKDQSTNTVKEKPTKEQAPLSSVEVSKESSKKKTESVS